MRRRIGLVVGLVALMASTLAAPAFAHRSADRVAVVDLETGATTGHSLMVRGTAGIKARLATSGLVPGDAYTVWAVIFNTPEGCEGPCDGSDLSNPDANAVSLLGAGGVAEQAAGRFTVRIRSGDALTDPFGAEVHLVLRTHGPALPDLVHEQTSTLNGGCPPNTCANVLMAKHT